jgi:UDP-N-acetylmuramate dehydrogenase
MDLQKDVDLSAMNTLGLPSTARYLLRAESEQQVAEAVLWARRHGLGLLVLGAGSNVVLPRRIEALVLHLVNRGIRVVASTGQRVTVDVAAGVDWHRLVSDMLCRGLHGLENLALIPGVVGAAPVQNIGAYGVELEQFVVSVRALDTATLEWQELTRQDCCFSYRNSLFRCRPQRYIISQLRLGLSHSVQVNDSYGALKTELNRRGIERALPAEVFDAVVAIRQGRLPDPRAEPNAGSFFKNPLVSDEHYRHLRLRYPDMVAFPQGDGRVKLAAAWLIEGAGFKGRFREGVGMHPQQALVLVNRGSADAARVLEFAGEVATTVKSLFDVNLQREPLLVRSDGSCSAV